MYKRSHRCSNFISYFSSFSWFTELIFESTLKYFLLYYFGYLILLEFFFVLYIFEVIIVFFEKKKIYIILIFFSHSREYALTSCHSSFSKIFFVLFNIWLDFFLLLFEMSWLSADIFMGIWWWWWSSWLFWYDDDWRI